MRLLTFSFFFLVTSGCVTSKFFKFREGNINQESISTYTTPLPEFTDIDTNKDGIVTKAEHNKAQENINYSIVTPYMVFGGMLLAIIIICFLSGIRYGQVKKTIKETYYSARTQFINLLTKWKERKKSTLDSKPDK